MNSKLRWLMSLAALATASCFLTACNTADGVGRDVEELGEEVQDAAN